MSVLEKVTAELKNALKEKNTIKISALREILTALKYKEKETGTPLKPEQEIEVLSRLKKKHLESISAFEQGGRQDLVEKEKAELEVIEQYLPKPLTQQEIQQMVRDAIQTIGAKSMKDMGKVMSALRDKYIGRADGKVVSEEVKKQLSELAEQS